jgi:glyoxylase-like metal-dependent hydrolase (beta-lactamase superfamily II)
MISPEPAREIAPGIVLVDTGYIRPGLAASYLVRGTRGAAIVETGSAPTVHRVLRALDAVGIARDDVEWVIVTHVHLDHAGGAGALLRELPRARLAVNPRGARHAIDPSKLLAGTSAVYGSERTRELYGELVPAPADRVVEAPEGFVLDLGNRPLRFLDAPGHARHHSVILDEETRGFFSGDVFGISYRESDLAGRPFIFPTTTPVQFDPPAWHATLDRMLAERPERVYLTHFGMLEGDIARHAASLRLAIDEHVRRALSAPTGPGRHEALVSSLEEQLLDSLRAHGANPTREEALGLFGGDLELNAQGLEVWLDAPKRA